MTLKALIRTASGKEGGKNTGTKVTTKAWHEGTQRLTPFLLCNDEWGWRRQLMMLWRSMSVLDYLIGRQTTFSVTIITVSARPGNCCAWIVWWSTWNQSDTLKDAFSKRMKLTCPERCQLCLEKVRAEKSHDWWDSNSQPSNRHSKTLTTTP